MSDTNDVKFEELSPELQEEYRSTIEEEAKRLNVKFKATISTEQLYARVKAAREGIELTDEQLEEENIKEGDKIAPNLQKVNLVPQDQLQLSPELQRQKKREYLETKVRVQVTCNDPMKAAWQGEIIEVSNNLISRKKEFVPFNVPWHVNRFILNALEEKTFTQHYTVKTPKGMVNRHRLAKAYNVTPLPALTKEEIQAIARKQLAAKDTEEAYNSFN